MEDQGFESFWAAFPRRVAKQAALRAYRKALKLTTSDEIIKGATLYARDRQGQDAQFTKHPATWLNGGCWSDYAAVISVPAGVPAGFYAAFCSPELAAWERYGRSQGRSYPRDKRGGWTFPTRWPPEVNNGPRPETAANHCDLGRHSRAQPEAMGTWDQSASEDRSGSTGHREVDF